MIIQALAGFLVACGFAIMFDVPKKLLIQCGLVGTMGWLIYFYLFDDIETVQATFVASFAIGIISHLFSKLFKAPVIIFTVGGIMPIVPGGTAYDAMRNFVLNNYDVATQLSVKVMLVAGSIALGIVFSEVFNQGYKKIVFKVRKTNKV